jgi:release factor glutamine methyltransferase
VTKDRPCDTQYAIRNTYASPNSVLQTLKQASDALAAAGCDTPRLDAEVLLAHALNRDRAWLYARPEQILSSHQLSVYQSLVSCRARREPVAYLTGCKEFFGLEFIVTRDVLIPRPETERLVELALQWVAATSSPPIIADVGTGSGAIAVTLAVHLPQAYVVATDTSPAALVVAQRNAARHGVANRVRYVQGDLLAPLARRWRCSYFIVANPPYLSQAELAAAPPEVARWEPRAALDGGPDGLSVIRRLLVMAADRLHPGGTLLLEIGAGQGAEVLKLAHRHFPQAIVEIARDYAERDRLLAVRHAR